MRRKGFFIFVAGVCLMFICADGWSADNRIIVHCGQTIGLVNRNVFGSNVLAHDVMGGVSDVSFSDFGAGIWNPDSSKPDAVVMEHSRKAGISVLRFPGGCGAHHYRWKDGIGRNRATNLFGLDEFLLICEQLEATPVITVSFFEGDPQDAADLVAYVNAQADDVSADNSARDFWAVQRIRNGRQKPYGVRYFEIGNEVWHGDHGEVSHVDAHEYARRYLAYYDAMKAVDPSISIGVVLGPREWNEQVLEQIREKVDFGILHLYPNAGAEGDELALMAPQDVLSLNWVITVTRYPVELQQMKKILARYAGKDVPVAVTEYNVGFAQEDPVPYRYSLGAALTVAEMIRIFLQPPHQVLLANYWNLVNEYWGLVSNGFSGGRADSRPSYFKRPAYYVFELYHDYFGDALVRVENFTSTFPFKDYGYFFADIVKDIPKMTGPALVATDKDVALDQANGVLRVKHLSVIASKSDDGQKVYLIVVNKNITEAVTTQIELQEFASDSVVVVRVLNGLGLDATNEKARGSIGLHQQEFPVTAGNFSFDFEPHSVTAMEILRRD